MPATKNVPLNAMQLTAGVFTLGDNGEDAKSAPIEMVALSGQPIAHWWWGQIVHDLSGMNLHKDRLPIDYCHDDEQILGYLNKFGVDTGKLVASGALTPYGDDDRAIEVMHKARAGVPYEASVFWGGDGIRLEELAEGQTAEVNGYALTGPATIVREWPLRGIAVCPYGADMNTVSTTFNAGREVPVTVLNQQGENEMSDTDTPIVAEVQTDETPVEAEAQPDAVETEEQAAEGDQPVETDTETPKEATEQTDAAPGQKFMDRFGEQRGALYFARGLTFGQAMDAYVDDLEVENTKLREQVDSFSRGEDEPVKFQSGESDNSERTKFVKSLDGKAERGVAALAARFATKKQ